MSRFYDALREASRSQPVTPPAHEEQAAGIVTDDAPSPASLFNHPALAEVVSPLAFEPEIKPAEAPVVQQILDEPEPEVTPDELLKLALQGDSAPANGVLGIKAQLHLDAGARLLPHAADSVVVEYYRRLRTKILQQHTIKPFRSLVIASAAPLEGKTVTTLNLGMSFAMLPKFKVLVVDGDLRRGTIGKWLGVEKNRPGLSDLLEGTARFDDVVLRCEETGVHFMVRGRSNLAPAELLHAPRLSSQFRKMAEHFDLILVDSAPLNLVTDVQLLASHCDAMLLVARAFHSTRKGLEQAVRELSSFRVIGTVLNGGSRTRSYRRYNGYYTHD